MQGYQITFFTQQGLRHGHLPLGEWLVQEARKLGAASATLITAAEGFGLDRKLHSAHFFELADQPIEVQMVLGETETDKLFDCLRQAKINLFYVKTPIEFGQTGDT